MDLKGILLILADTNQNGKVDLGDLPGVIERVTAARASIDAIESALKGLAGTGSLTSNGADVTPEQLAQLFDEARDAFAALDARASASKAAIDAEGKG